MNILITGGAGFIGNNLVRKLLLNKEVKEIVVLDNHSSGMSIFLPNDSRVKLVVTDIDKLDKLNFVLNQHNFDYVFHLAAHFANQNSVDHPFSDIQTNIIGTVGILEALKNHRQLKKFVYASSSCVYGTSKEMRESAPVYPSETPYSINKYAAEMYTQYYAHLFNLPTVSIRIFNTYGPYELAGKYRNVIPNFIQNALDNKDLIITGSGEETRDFTYVDDVVDLMISSAFSKFKEGQIFNSGTGIKTTINDIAQKILLLTNSSSKIEHTNTRKWDKVKDRVSDITKSVSDLSYNPKTGVDEGLAQTIAWYTDNYEKVNTLKNYFE